MSTIKKYIIIDDDLFNNIICSMVIRNALVDADIRAFSVPEEGLAFIEDEYVKKSSHTVLFLDINMPTLTGWDFISQYEQFNEKVKEQITIYILSSSIDQRDKDKAIANKYIKGFLTKPLTTETILSIAEA